MQRFIMGCALLCVMPLECAWAVSIVQHDETDVTVLHVADDGPLDDIRRRVLGLVDDGRRMVVAGDRGRLAELKPEGILAWPATNTIVIDPRVGLAVSGFDAADAQARAEVLAAWPWGDDALPVAVSRQRREPALRYDVRHVEFDIRAESPSSACRSFYQKVSASLLSSGMPRQQALREFRREVRRWCQYGNLSVHRAAPAQFTIEPFRTSSDPLLSLVTEWALIRIEDASDPSKTRYRFWTKVVGEGAGTGFSRRDGAGAFYDPLRGVVHNLMDVAIHSGWGAIEGRDVVTAWPLNSTFPASGNIHAFRCEAPVMFRPEACPDGLMLRRLLPTDSVNDTVTVSRGTTMSFSGDAKTSLSGDTEGKRAVSFTLGFVVVNEQSSDVSMDMALAHTRTNANTQFYRSTRWVPDLDATFRWLYAHAGTTSLAMATRLASTLNPSHEIVWELPLAGNGGRRLPYNVIYEAGLNTCTNGTHCVGYRRSPDASLPTKARVGWSDGIVVTLPSR